MATTHPTFEENVPMKNDELIIISYKAVDCGFIRHFHRYICISSIIILGSVVKF